MRPFLLLATRDDIVAATELQDVLRAGELAPDELVQLRLDQQPLPDDFDLDDYSGIILGGSPYNSSDPEDEKSETQRRVEADLNRLLDDVVARDYPFLGLCYGVGTLGRYCGGVVDRTYGEKVGPITITLTPEAASDQLASVMPQQFEAFVAHKEALTTLPEGAALLGTGEFSPHQFFRIGHNVYATQFHPELDAPSLMARIARYHGHGYFESDEVDAIGERAYAADVSRVPRLLSRFVELFRRA